jgi:hypothetical protein
MPTVELVSEIRAHEISILGLSEETSSSTKQDSQAMMASNAYEVTQDTSSSEEEKSSSSGDEDESLAPMMERFSRLEAKIKLKGYVYNSKKHAFQHKSKHQVKRCSKCKRRGHKASSCPRKPTPSEEISFDICKREEPEEEKEVTKERSVAALSFIQEQDTHCLIAKESNPDYTLGGEHYVMDSGYSQHMTGNPSIFTKMENPKKREHVTFGDSSQGEIRGLGKIAITKDLSLSNVLYVYTLSFNLLSIAQLCDYGLTCTFTKTQVVVTHNEDKSVMFKGFQHDHIYLVDFEDKDSSITCLIAKTQLDWLWYRRIAHIGISNLKES